MDDDDRRISVDVSDLKDDCGGVRADHHGESVAEVPDSDRVSVCVEDLALVQSVLQSGLGDDRVIH